MRHCELNFKPREMGTRNEPFFGSLTVVVFLYFLFSIAYPALHPPGTPQLGKQSFAALPIMQILLPSGSQLAMKSIINHPKQIVLQSTFFRYLHRLRKYAGDHHLMIICFLRPPPKKRLWSTATIQC